MIRVVFACAILLSIGLMAATSWEHDNPPPRHPDFGFMPAAGQYEGRVFRLSQDYPRDLPAAATISPLCTNDFEDLKRNWKSYMLAVRDYCFEGNVYGGDVQDDWQLDEPRTRRWFHMPWQHFGAFGREGIHGLTTESHVRPRQLAWTQTSADSQTFAVAFYNDFGGYTIGQVFSDPGRAQEKLHIEFPVGTIVCKLLFVDVPLEQVPSLNPPLLWQAYVPEGHNASRRRIRDVALIQMDFMIRHKTAPLGWLFGTFQYNGQRKNADRANLWNNLVPVGLQWGNDPYVREHSVNPQPTQTLINPKIRESIINPDADELPPTHLGWGGRLNGPVDNPMSSCLSCHMAAETPTISQISPLFEESPPPPGSDAWMRWFRNPGCLEPFDKGATSTDFSLQMALALQNYWLWRNEGEQMRAEDFKATRTRSRIKDASPARRNVRSMHDYRRPFEIEIRRDIVKPDQP